MNIGQEHRRHVDDLTAQGSVRDDIVKASLLKKIFSLNWRSNLLTKTMYTHGFNSRSKGVKVQLNFMHVCYVETIPRAADRVITRATMIIFTLTHYK